MKDSAQEDVHHPLGLPNYHTWQCMVLPGLPHVGTASNKCWGEKACTVKLIDCFNRIHYL